MEKAGARVINFLFVGAIVFPTKAISDPAIASDCQHPEHCINEPTQTSHTRLKPSNPEPSATLCGNDGIPFCRIGGNIYAKNAVSVQRNEENISQKVEMKMALRLLHTWGGEHGPQGTREV